MHSAFQLSLSVDSVYSKTQQTVGRYEWLSNVVAYVGGKPIKKLLPQGLEMSNFIGCLTKVIDLFLFPIIEFYQKTSLNEQ